MIKPFYESIPELNSWKMYPSDAIFTTVKNIIFGPISNSFGIVSKNLDIFVIQSKKCYNSNELREHICLVMNYFEKFFDKDKELLLCMSKIKYRIDIDGGFNRDMFVHDVSSYILSDSIINKVKTMTDHNYHIDLTYNNISPSLRYTNDHAKVFMNVSILIDFVIPLITHFAHKNHTTDINELILDIYDVILYSFPDVDIFSKLYTTSYSNVSKTEPKNQPLWAKQDIRGKDIVTHAKDCVDNIIINIASKYDFDRNAVALNYTSINKNTNFQILDIGYEFGFVPLSSSKRDGEDSSSEFEKYEAGIIKSSEAIYLQNKVNCQETMKTIESQFGPFNEDIIVKYRNALKNDCGNYINYFQKQMLFNMFYKYFGDTDSIYEISPATDYIKLMLAGKKILENNFMTIMPYVISGKFEKLVPRKTINKKEEKDLKTSSYYNMILEKYKNNDKIVQQVLSFFATVMSSTIRYITPENPELDGKIIDTIPGIVLEELCLMTLLF